jgi:putative peptidoglycan lipid II flippase
LAVGVLAGGILQLSLQVPFLIQKGFSFFKKTVLIHPGLTKIGRLILPAILGAGVYQVNILVGTLLGSLLPEGSISYLYYADRLVQFPLGIFALSIATAALPSLSRQAADKDINGLKGTFAYTLKLIFYIMLPAMAGLIVLRDPIISILFQRGAFDYEAVRMTSDALLYYCLGIWATASVSVVVRVFYSLNDSKTPVYISIISIFINIILSIILMKPMAHCGLALSTSLASILNLSLLVLMLRIKLGPLGWRNIILSAGKSTFAALIMGIAVRYTAGYVIPVEYNSQAELAFGLTVSVIVGMISYTALSIIVKSSEFRYVLAMIRKGGTAD